MEPAFDIERPPGEFHEPSGMGALFFTRVHETAASLYAAVNGHGNTIPSHLRTFLLRRRNRVSPGIEGRSGRSPIRATRSFAPGAGLTAMRSDRYVGSKENLFAEAVAETIVMMSFVMPRMIGAPGSSDLSASVLVDITMAGATLLEGAGSCCARHRARSRVDAAMPRENTGE